MRAGRLLATRAVLGTYTVTAGVLALLTAVGACGAATAPAPAPAPRPALPRPAVSSGPRWWDALDTATVRIPMLVATTRVPVPGVRPGLAFGLRDTTLLSFADATLSLPSYRHRIDGAVVTPRDGQLPDPTHDVLVDSLAPLDSARFTTTVAARRDRAPGAGVVVYVHGYDKSFERSAARLAQIAADIGFDGALVLFTWPSADQMRMYARDQVEARAAGTALRRVLASIAARGAGPVRLVSHSMGAEVIAAALAAPAPAGLRLDDVILLAPDLDADGFGLSVLPVLTTLGARVTIYASAHDDALRASHRVNRSWRLGLAGDSLRLFPGVTTIDASRLHGEGLTARLGAGEPLRAGVQGAILDALGHDLFEHPLVLADLRELIVERMPPERRRLLAVTDAAGRRYWRFR